MDRIYLGVARKLRVEQPSLNTSCELETSAELADAVVWNPWIDKVNPTSELIRVLRIRLKVISSVLLCLSVCNFHTS